MPARKKTRKKRIRANSASTKKTSTRKESKARGAKTGTRRKTSRNETTARKRSSQKAVHTRKRGTRNRNQAPDRISAQGRLRAESVNESGDLQGLGTLAEADSESARELLEEGNAFEADLVSGVEAAGDKPEREVRPRQVREDDVPEEYLENE